MDLKAELERRYANVRAAMAQHSLDVLVVSGSEYTGFEGSVTYLSGFQIVHRYAYVVVPADGEPQIVFPSEARYVGEHGTARIEQVFADRPGQHIADTARDRGWRRIGVYGLDYIMTVRDFRALEAPGLELVSFDAEFDLARAVKSEAELESVRDSVRINEEGFEVFFSAYRPGRTAAELMAPAEEFFVREGCGRLTMNMVLAGAGHGAAPPEFRIARSDTVIGDFVLPSLEVAGPGMHWVEVSRAIADAWPPSPETMRMMEAYDEYYEAARPALRAGATAHDAHRAVSRGFSERGWNLGHVTGHSIGMTMIEHPRVGEGVDVELRENMVLSMHPHAISADGATCLYMQDTWLVTADGGVPLSRLPMKIYLREP